MRISVPLVAGATLFAVGGAQAETVTLSLSSWAGPNHAISRVGLKNWADAVAKKSSGSLKINISFPPVNPKVMYDRAREGISDVTWGFNGYTPGRFKTYLLAELPGLAAGAEAASVAYWRTHVKYLAKANEYRGVKLLALFVQPPSVVHSRDELDTPAKMKGKKIRVGGGIQGKVASLLGMVGVQAPVPEAYQMLKEGVVDGTFFPAETAISFKLTEVTKHQLGFRAGLFYGAYFVVMNPRKYESLSKAHKAVIDGTTGEALARTIGTAWQDSEKAAIAALEKAGTFKFASPELSKAVMERLKPLDAEYVKEASSTGIDGRAALEFLRREAKTLSAK